VAARALFGARQRRSVGCKLTSARIAAVRHVRAGVAGRFAAAGCDILGRRRFAPGARVRFSAVDGRSVGGKLADAGIAAIVRVGARIADRFAAACGNVFR